MTLPNVTATEIDVMTRRFLTKLQVEDIDGNKWKLTAPLVYVQDGRRYTVPAGFITDFASVPGFVFWRSKSGKHNEASVLHDAMYSGEVEVVPHRIITRKDADLLFRDAMQASGVGKWSRNVMYAAVRLGGKGRFHGDEVLGV
jgi:hypothetical protein